MIVEFLLEEPSMANFLEKILPKILPQVIVLEEKCFIRPHNGKSDLQKSIPRKIKTFSNVHYEEYRVVIVHDQDSNDCKKLKYSLRDLCAQNGDCAVLIRIACRELEAWYLGDMMAIEKAYPQFKAEKYQNKALFRNPDMCNAADEMSKLIPQKLFQKGQASKLIPQYMTIAKNTSPSFNTFVTGLQHFLSK